MKDDTVVTMTCRLGALCFMLALAGCTAWSDERERHYSWLYQKCMRGEHEPYTIHLSPNDGSAQAQRCREEYEHYVGDRKKT